MAITRHIQGWTSLHPLNSELTNISDSRCVQQEKMGGKMTVSPCEGTAEEGNFCNLGFDPISEVLQIEAHPDRNYMPESCQVSSVSLQSESFLLWRNRPSRITIVIIIISVLLLVLILSLTLGILLSKRKIDVSAISVSVANYSNTSVRDTSISRFTEIVLSNCGGYLNDSQGSFSSPNYPHLYPPNSHCTWVLEAQEGHVIQMKIVVLDIEGYGSCLIDWLELTDGNTTSRLCGSVAPTTFISISHWLQLNFVSDNSINAQGFLATYRMIEPSQGSCSWDEFLCDGRRCVLLPALCDGIPDCADRMDETNCSQIQWDCGGSLNSLQGSISSPNYPEKYPGKILCRWHLSVPDEFVIQLQFHDFSLEMERGCTFDYVEIHDSTSLGTASMMGRFCGSHLPPNLTSSGPHMYIVFVSDEEESGLGFFATYEAFNATAIQCDNTELRCDGGQCLSLQLVCDGWIDCPDGKDELDCPDREDTEPVTPCQPLRVPLCKGLSYTLTVFPNLWMSLHEQPAASELLKGYKTLQELPCFPALRPLLCALLVPSCSPSGGSLQPCRSVCLNAEHHCQDQIHQLGLPWSFSCDLYPTQMQQPDCVIP
ncbi:membrane frizzled-related [Pelobates cultripes]|uniref:Membrane frizzled-related n=1 Tax=Pelobates cultripes TaxID=61616 RepID=A0AAD1TAA9_PELCU|nr:membrane frizzled-related [Pelobates cultripes]